MFIRVFGPGVLNAEACAEKLRDTRAADRDFYTELPVEVGGGGRAGREQAVLAHCPRRRHNLLNPPQCKIKSKIGDPIQC